MLLSSPASLISPRLSSAGGRGRVFVSAAHSSPRESLGAQWRETHAPDKFSPKSFWHPRYPRAAFRPQNYTQDGVLEKKSRSSPDREPTEFNLRPRFVFLIIPGPGKHLRRQRLRRHATSWLLFDMPLHVLQELFKTTWTHTNKSHYFFYFKFLETKLPAWNG